MNRENQNIEYKLIWKDEYLKWICGFANAKGGTIYIGIDDNGDIAGVKNAQRLLEDIPNKIVNALGIVADVNLHNDAGKEYIEVVVHPSNVPISYQGGYFYRSGSTKQELKGNALQQFILKKLGRSWDDIACEGATIDDIDPEAIKYFIRKATAAKRMPVGSEEDDVLTVLENLNLIDSNGNLKNAAVLIFGKKPAKFFVGAEFKIGRFGSKESDLMFQDVVDGNILQMADRVMEILKSKYLISPIHYEGLQRIEPLEIPEDAFREAIFNAIIHKQYAGIPIQMKVYNDSIWLWNDGDLPEGFTVETLLNKHTSKPRNGNIANVFYKAGFIESWGRGINKIREGFTANGFPEPKIQTEMGGVSIIFPRRTNLSSPKGSQNSSPKNPRSSSLKGSRKSSPKNSQKSSPKNPRKSSQVDAKIVELMTQRPQITLVSIANALGISKRYVTKRISLLKERSQIKRVGGRKVGQWQVISQ